MSCHVIVPSIESKESIFIFNRQLLQINFLKKKNKQLYFRKFRYSMIRGNNLEEFRLIIQ